MVRLALAAVFLICFPASAPAQAPTLWGGLEPGPYAVGYRASFELDRSRVFFPERDFRGTAQPGERARPVLLRVWYPARPAAAARRITYGDYLRFESPTPRLRDVADAYAARTKLLHDFVTRKYAPAGAADSLRRVEALPMAAVAGARPAAGRFPVVVYGGGAEHSTDENPVLWEFLASHGYVVAVVPAQHLRSVAFSADAAGLEALARDMEFALARMRDVRGADLDRVATAGFSYGGAAALLVAMRNSDVDAVVAWDSSVTSAQYSKALVASPTYDPLAVAAPVLEMHGAGPGLTGDVVDALRYSRRSSFEIRGLDHTDFNSYPLLFAAVLGDRPLPGLSLGARRAAYEAMSRRTLDFLDANLKGDGAAAGRLSAPLAIPGVAPEAVRGRALAGLPRPISSEELLALVLGGGAGRAEAEVRALRARDPLAPSIAENALNKLGYTLLARDRPADAIRVFRWNVEAHPDSAGLFDSLADGYRAAGNEACAAAAYRKVLELLPRDTTADAAAKESLRRTAEDQLARPGAAGGDCAPDR